MRKIYHIVCRAEEIICGLGFIALVGLVFLSAILRMFRFSMAWNIDMAMLLLAWTAFLGADIAYRSGQLVGIDIVTRNLPKKLKAPVEILVLLFILAALGGIVYFGIRLAKSEWIRKYQSMPIPYSFVTVSIVFASASMVCSTIIKIVRRVTALFRPAGEPGRAA
ncbi:MAG: TRAP transporter small permease [Spirochaetaceae bacterium]|nr:TRAP transporter small permease [Spirochaetaceae bacterium]